VVGETDEEDVADRGDADGDQALDELPWSVMHHGK